MIYAKESVRQLSELYYLVLWKGYSKKKNIWEPTSAIQHLQRLVIAYYKDNLKKLTMTSVPIDTASPMVRPIAPPMIRPTMTLIK